MSRSTKIRRAFCVVAFASVSVAVYVGQRCASDSTSLKSSTASDVAIGWLKWFVPTVNQNQAYEPVVLVAKPVIPAIPQEREPDSPTAEEQLLLSEELYRMEIELANAQAAADHAVHDVVIQTARHDRAIADAELRLALAKMDQHAFVAYQYEGERSSLREAVLLSERRHELALNRLQWSQRLADRALISQAALETDQAAVARRSLELSMARGRLTVLEQSTYKKRTLLHQDSVRSLEHELAQLKKLKSKATRELASTVEASAQALDRAISRRNLLSSKITREPRDGDVVQIQAGLASAEQRVELHRRTMEQLQNTETKIQTELEWQKLRRDVDLEHAELAVRTAELALKEYLEGIYPQTRHKILSEISNIKERLDRARQRVAWSQRVIAKGYVTESQLEADKLVVAEHEAELNETRRQLELLGAFTHPRRKFELMAQLDEAEKELTRTRRTSDALLATSESAMAAHQYKLEHQRELLDQLLQPVSAASNHEPDVFIRLPVNEPAVSTTVSEGD